MAVVDHDHKAMYIVGRNVLAQCRSASCYLSIKLYMSTDYMPPCTHDLHVLCMARSCMNMHLGFGRDMKTGYHLIHIYIPQERTIVY